MCMNGTNVYKMLQIRTKWYKYEYKWYKYKWYGTNIYTCAIKKNHLNRVTCNHPMTRTILISTTAYYSPFLSSASDKLS